MKEQDRDFFESLMVDLRATPAQVAELEVAYRQTSQGFELIAARAKQGDVPVGLLLTLVRKGLHLKAAGQSDDERGSGGLFRCKVCGPLGGTNSDTHYDNFPEHREGRHIPPTNVRPPPATDRRDTVVRSTEELLRESG